MKYLLWFVFSALILHTARTQTQSPQFDYQPHKLPIQQMQLYKKSNLDGTRVGYIAVYLKDSITLESFKWTPGNRAGTLVIAQMDWSRFSVSEFIGMRMQANGEVTQTARLSIAHGAKEANVQIGNMEPSTVLLQHFPWHSYDFDFASLGLVMPFKQSRTTTFEFMISDITRTPSGPVFGEVGKVSLLWQIEEEKFGVACQRYSIDGPGLNNRGGHIWFDQQGQLAGFEIQQADEPGYESGRLERVEVSTMTGTAWEAFKKAKLGADR